jgi:hypothetical protein
LTKQNQQILEAFAQFILQVYNILNPFSSNV